MTASSVLTASRLPWRTAWITGASTGIGRAVALGLARGGVTVAASARGTDKLAELAASDPRIKPYPLDVTDAAAVAATAARVAGEHGPIDLAILCAGVWHPMPASHFSAADAAQTIQVNVIGMTNALAVLLPPMIARRGGHVAMVASVAGYRGLPNGAAYGASKAAIINLAEALKPDLERYGVKLSIVNPGFVDTPMTAVNTFPMPFMIPVEEASRRMIAGLAAGRYEIAFPRRMVAMMKLARLLPNAAFFWAVRNMVMPRSGADKK